MNNITEFLEIKPQVDLKVIKETLTRMGVANKREKTIFPSCYLYEEKKQFFLVHFKQLFTLTRSTGYNNMSKQDYTRRNAIAFCLKNWNLINVPMENIEPHNVNIFVLPFGDKSLWSFSHKFNMSVIETGNRE